jgi:hypothetical protein
MAKLCYRGVTRNGGSMDSFILRKLVPV